MSKPRSHGTISGKPHHVLIANYSGYIVGDDAMFDVLLDCVGRACGQDVVVHALTAMPERTRQRYPAIATVDHIYEYTHSRASRQRVLSMLAHADLVIIGGGDIVEGQLALVLLTGIAALMGIPVAFAGVGVLMPSGKRRQHMLRWTLNRARFVATRDAESAELLEALGISRPLLVTIPDLAIGIETLRHGGAHHLLARENIRVARPYIALNLRPPEPNQYRMTWGDAEYDAVARVCQTLVDRDGYDLVCIPLLTRAADPPLESDVPSDDALMLDLARRVERPEHVHVLRGDYRPHEVATILRDAQLAIGMRLHFIVLAAAVQVPMVALNYARKVRAFMSHAGIEQYCIDVAGLDSQSLRCRVKRAIVERDELTRSLSIWHDEAKTQLAALEPMLTSLAADGGAASHLRRTLGRVGAGAVLSVAQAYGTARRSLDRLAHR